MTRRFFNFTLYLLALTAIVLAVLTTLLSYFLKDLTYYTELTLDLLKEKTGCNISISDINWDILRGTGIKIDNLKIIDASNQRLLCKIKRVYILSELLPLFRKQLIVSKIILEEPELFVFRDENGQWKIFTVPDVKPEPLSQDKKSFDFSISLKNLFITNGKLFYKDYILHKTSDFDHVNLKLRLNHKTGKYLISLAAEHKHKKGKGVLAFDGDFSFLSTGFNFKNLSVKGTLNLEKISLAGFLPYVMHSITFPEADTLLDTNFRFTLEPGLNFKADGHLKSSRINVSLSNGKPFTLDNCSLGFSVQANPDSLELEKLDLSLTRGININGNLSVTGLRYPSPLFDLKFSSNRFSITSFVKYVNDTSLLTDPYRSILNRVTGGEIELKNIHWQGHVKNRTAEQIPVLHGKLEIKNMFVETADQMPPLRIDASCEIHNDTVFGVLTAKCLPGDTHTAHFESTSLFNNPCFKADILSMCPSKSLNKLIPSTDNSSRKPVLEAVAGITTAKTKISISKKFVITSDIDLTRTAYMVSGSIMKPAGLTNKLYLQSSPAEDTSHTTFSFHVVLGSNLLLEGTIKGGLSPVINSRYTLNSFDITSFKFPALPPAMQVKGAISGEGSFQVPFSSSFQLPFKGSMSISGFELSKAESVNTLISASIETETDGNQIFIKTCSVRLGESSFTASGKLSGITPPRGNLSVNADFFDIDDCVRTIQSIVKLSKQQDKKISTTDNNFFTGTSLDIDLKPEKTNFLGWDFGRGSTRFSIKNGVMLWDDISIQADNGIIKGAVLYDLSNPHSMQLKFMPRESNIDFLWCIPTLKESKIITGVLNLSGEFSSTFEHEGAIVPNMQGDFHVSITNGKIRKFTILSKILTILSIKRLLKLKNPDFFSQGMPFDSIEAGFVMEKGLMKTDNFIMKGPAMNLSAVGTINLLSNEVDLTIGAQPLETIGKIVGNIPIAKNIFTGKDKSLTVGYFHVKGPYENASVTIMPLKSLSSAVIKVFKSIFNIPLKIISPKNDNSSKKRLTE